VPALFTIAHGRRSASDKPAGSFSAVPSHA